MRADRATAAVRAKQLFGLVERRESSLCTFEFVQRGGTAEFTERRSVSESVIADAVAFFNGAPGDRGARGVADFFAEDKKGGFQMVRAEAVEDIRGNRRLRPIVETQCYFPHLKCRR